MLRAYRRTNKYQLYSLWFDRIGTRTHDLPHARLWIWIWIWIFLCHLKAAMDMDMIIAEIPHIRHEAIFHQLIRKY